MANLLKTIIGRLGDIFGRRWFFIGGAFLALIGTLISALAVNINMLICGALIKALAASTQLSCFYAMAELVPAKYRYMLIGVLNIWQIPGAIMAPAIANSIILVGGSWRSVFYLLTAVNAASLICYFFFYHPPNFHQKHGRNEKRTYFIKNFDYFGTSLYATGLVFLLLGLSWGGGKYPWNSAYVISFIVIGIISFIAFVLWECLMDLKEPLLPLELFKNRDWVVATLLCGIGAGVFYAGASKFRSAIKHNTFNRITSNMANSHYQLLCQRKCHEGSLLVLSFWWHFYRRYYRWILRQSYWLPEDSSYRDHHSGRSSSCM